MDRPSEYYLLPNRVILSLSLSNAQAPFVVRPTTWRYKGSVADICLLRQESPRWTLCDFVFVVRTLQIVSEADILLHIYLFSLSLSVERISEKSGASHKECWSVGERPGSRTSQSYCSFFWENAETYRASTFDPDRSLPRTAYNVKESHRWVPWGSVTSVPEWQGLEEESNFKSVTHGTWRKTEKYKQGGYSTSWVLDLQEGWTLRLSLNFFAFLSTSTLIGEKVNLTTVADDEMTELWQKLRTFGIGWIYRLKRYWLFFVAKS